ncbi:hypothetical protein TCDM_12696 [Trypanosoma cruzi Dm28c]|uniref:Secreted protein n=1 Tax=Trypanosoma cruzi Dm28c TaxID=1416333 RepID=V5A4X1_TRYCR|nr:hypothetical protein TCDM_12696 [Trypanosoma cruzi Dm28c]
MIALLLFVEYFSSWQAAAATHSACSIPSFHIHVGMSRLPLARCLGASQPCGHRGQRRSTRRGGSNTVSFTQDKGDMFPSWEHACQSRDAVLRPFSVGWQMVVRVHVNGWTSSGRHTVRVAHSCREKRRCGRCSTLPVPGRRKTEIPCRLGWRRGPLLPSLILSNRHAAYGVNSCRKQPLRTKTTNVDRKESSVSHCREGCRGSPRACWGRPVGTRGRQWSSGSWCQQRQALARQGVAHRNSNATGTPTAGLVEVTAASEPRRWGTLMPALLRKNHAGMVLRQSSSKGNPEGRRD